MSFLFNTLTKEAGSLKKKFSIMERVTMQAKSEKGQKDAMSFLAFVLVTDVAPERLSPRNALNTS